MTTMIKFHIILFFLLTSCSQHKKDQQVVESNTLDSEAKVLIEKNNKDISNSKNKLSTDHWLHEHIYKHKDCIDNIKHSHKYKETDKNHIHNRSGSCQSLIDMKKKYNSEHPQVDVFTLQEKLKAKGYYRGPINGVVTDETRKALEKFMGRK